MDLLFLTQDMKYWPQFTEKCESSDEFVTKRNMLMTYIDVLKNTLSNEIKNKVKRGPAFFQG